MMKNHYLFENISPFVRFSATQNLSIGSTNYIDSDVIAYDHRIYYCVNGEGKIYINNKLYLLKPYTILIWSSGNKYRCTPSNNDLICITANFDFYENKEHNIEPIPPVSASKISKEQIFEKDVFFEDCELFSNVVYIQNIPECYETMKELAQTYRNKTTYNKLFLKGLIIKLFNTIINRVQSNNINDNKQNIIEIIRYVESNYNRDITNEEIARKFNYHPNYLSKLFLDYTGFTLHNYLIKYRLSKAVKLLLSTNLPISKICEEINILDPHYFSRIFKKYYKISPRQFRQKL